MDLGTFDKDKFLATWDALAAAFAADPVIEACDMSNVAKARKSIAAMDLADATWESFFAILYDYDNPAYTYPAALVARHLLDGVRRPTVVTGKLEIEATDDRLGEVKLVGGDLHVQGNLLNHGCLIVLGSLVVDGEYSSSQEPIAHLVVIGGMRASYISNDSWLSVQGDVDVANVVFGRYNDRCSAIGGALRTPLLLRENHFVLAPRNCATLDFDLAGPDETMQASARQLLLPELIVPSEDDEDQITIDQDALFVRLGKGHPVFSGSPPHGTR